jgi:zinc protease
VFTDPELSTASVETLTVGPRQVVTTVGDYRQHLIERLGTWMVNRRLDQLIQEGKAAFQSAEVSTGNLFSVASQASAEAEAKPAVWAEALDGLMVEVARARQHGFTDRELQGAKSAFLAAAEHAAQTESTRDARRLISRMNRALTDGEQPRAAAQSLNLQRQLLPGVTTQEVTSMLARRFAPEAQTAVVLLPQRPDVPVPSPDEVLAVMRGVSNRPLTPWQGAERPTALLDEVPAAGAMAEEAHDAVLDVTHVTFANHVRLHYRFMDFKKDHVMVAITLAGGKIRETEAQRGITAVAVLPLMEPATSRFSSTALRDYMTGKKVSVRAMMTDDAIELHITGTPEALEEGFALAHVLLRGAKIEPASVALWKQQQLQALEARQNQVQDLTLEAAALVLSGNDPRMRVLSPEQVEARAQAIPAAQAWLDQLLQTAPIEVAIVGDLPQGRALALAATYLGSLPKRARTDPGLAALRQVADFRGPVERKIEVDTITPRALPILMWRSAPWSDVRGRRLSYLVASILERRLREEIRENHGLTYSTSAYAEPAKVYPAMSALYVKFTTDPDKTQEAVQLARKVVETFAAEGPTDDEVHTARKQISHAVETMMQEPRFWVNLLSDLDYHGTRLDDVHNLIDKLTAYSKADIATATRQIVRPERFAVVIGQPE